MLLESAFYYLFCRKFSLKLITFSESYARKQKWLSFSKHGVYTIQTSSSGIAKRPRDASCLSVVSFNSANRRVEFFIVSYVG